MGRQNNLSLVFRLQSRILITTVIFLLIGQILTQLIFVIIFVECWCVSFNEGALSVKLQKFEVEIVAA